MTRGRDRLAFSPDQPAPGGITGSPGDPGAPGVRADRWLPAWDWQFGSGPVSGAITSPPAPERGTTTAVSLLPHQDPVQVKLQIALPSLSGMSERGAASGCGSLFQGVECTSSVASPARSSSGPALEWI